MKMKTIITRPTWFQLTTTTTHSHSHSHSLSTTIPTTQHTIPFTPPPLYPVCIWGPCVPPYPLLQKPNLTPYPSRLSLTLPTLSVLNTPTSGGECAEENVLEEFLRDRQLHGDVITKYSDIVFQRVTVSSATTETDKGVDNTETIEQVLADEPEEGFLKLTKTQEWLLGETSAPINRKAAMKELQDSRERRRRLNILRYEALKRELLFMTLGIGAACTGYCLLTLSIEAAVSYASGVGFSCLYLQLLYQHADNMSKESIPQIFMQKRQKKIGIRSEDLKDFVERSIKGSGIALSSPRLVIPAAIYGLWILFHRNFASDFFDFQIVPAMLGLFAYKAAALVQVYRDNEDLRFIFPDNEETSDGSILEFRPHSRNEVYPRHEFKCHI